MSDENGHLNREILRNVGNHTLPEEAQVVFENETRPQRSSKKRWILPLMGLALFLAAGAAIVRYQAEPSMPPELNVSAPVPLAVATQAALPASQVPPLIVGEIAPTSGSFAAQTVAGVENRPLSPVETLQQPAQAKTPQAADIATLMQQQSVAKPSQPTPPPPAQPQPRQPEQVKLKPPTSPAPVIRLAPQKQEKSTSIAPQSKQVQSASMRNLGIIAIMTDGLLMKRGEEEVEVVIGESVPGLGILQRTNPKDKTVETDQRIYKLN